MGTTGQKLGRYELIAPTTGDRWLARQQGVDKRVEIRVLTGPDAASELARARDVAQIEHANLTRVVDVVEDGNERYVVTEHIEGVTLAELLATSKRLDELGITRVIADAAEAVDAAHEEIDGLVHGGVAPEMIGVAFSGQVKVSAIDTTGRGALAYTAPERLGGAAGDARSDVFSLGVVLWEALTHERLFDGSTDDAIRTMVRQLPIESPAMLNANVPAPLADVCMKALAQDPAVRYPSAKQLAVELEAVLTQAGYSRRNDQIAAFLGEAFADRAVARKRKASIQPDTAPIAAPTPAAAKPAAAGKAPTPTMTLPLPSVAPAKPVVQTMVMPPATVRPASTTKPPVPEPRRTTTPPPLPIPSGLPSSTLQMSAPPPPVVAATAVAVEAKPEPQANLIVAPPPPVAAPKGDLAATLPPRPAASQSISDLETAKIERPAITTAPTGPAAAIASAAESLPDAAAVVALPERPSLDVIGGWGWKTDSVPAIRDGDDDEPMPPPSRKPLLYAFGGAVALAAIITIVALASGGSADEEAPKKPAVAKAVEPPAPPPPTPVTAVAISDDAALAGAGPASGSAETPPPPPPIDAAELAAAPMVDAPPPPPPPPPVDAAPPPPDAAPPPPPKPPVPVAIDKTPPKPVIPDKPKKPADKPKQVAQVDKTPPKPVIPDKPKKPKGKDPKPVDPYETTDKPQVDVAAANRAGLQQFARGDTAGALATLRGSLAANPSYAPTWRSLGLIFQKLGERDQARAAFKRYLSLAPGADDADQIRQRLEQLGA